MKTFFKKLLVYSFDELVSDWIFILKDSSGGHPIAIMFATPIVFVGFVIDLQFAIKRTIGAFKKDIWKVGEREFGRYLFTVP